MFKNEEQIEEFKRIIQEIMETGNLEKAFTNIATIYIPKRKKIILNQKEIQDVAKKYDSTVELLSEYLVSNEEEIKLTERFSTGSDEEEIEVVINTKNESPFNETLNFNKVQLEVLKMIKNDSFVLSQKEVDMFAVENGVFKNQLIDSINEICYDLLEGEPLIEEDEENYIVEKSYFREIELKA